MSDEPRPLPYAPSQLREPLSRGTLVICGLSGLAATAATWGAVARFSCAGLWIGVLVAVGIGQFIAYRAAAFTNACVYAAMFGLPSSVILAGFGLTRSATPPRYPVILSERDFFLASAALAAVILCGVSIVSAFFSLFAKTKRASLQPPNESAPPSDQPPK